jgi:hypothetical protein
MREMIIHPERYRSPTTPIVGQKIGSENLSV